jgi:hypothetical protein
MEEFIEQEKHPHELFQSNFKILPVKVTITQNGAEEDASKRK